MSIAALALLLATAVHAQVTLPAVFSDHMVLQREMRVPIRGTAKPGEKVTVRFRDQETSTTTDAGGKWRVILSGLKAGGPDELTIVGANTITIRDVLVGEVWFGGGQSNMVGGLRVPAGTPQVRYAANGIWTVVAGNRFGFSAIAYHFGQILHKELKVPVGLYVNAVGGAPVGRLLHTHAEFAPFAVRGVLWDQGESGSAPYDKAMAELIGLWRKDWDQPGMAFVCVQKPSGGGATSDGDDPWHWRRSTDAVTWSPSDPAIARTVLTTAESPSRSIASARLLEHTTQLIQRAQRLRSPLPHQAHSPCFAEHGRQADTHSRL
jgi:sialate O-acetylesterase